MADQLTEDMILDILRQISVEGSTVDLVAAGMISGVVIKDGHVGFSLEIDPEDAEAIQPLRIAAENAVASLPGVLSASAMLTAHRKDKALQLSKLRRNNLANKTRVLSCINLQPMSLLWPPAKAVWVSLRRQSILRLPSAQWVNLSAFWMLIFMARPCRASLV